MSPRWQRSWVPASSPPWGIPWAAWSPSWCTSGTPRCCRSWCCAPPRATSHAPGTAAGRLRAAGRQPPACGGTRCCSWSAPRSWDRLCWVRSRTRPPQAGPAPSWARTTLASAVSAIRAVCEFGWDRWIGQVDVPAAVVVTTQDRIVPVGRQLQLAQTIPGAALHRVDADHAVCITAPQVFDPRAARGMPGGAPPAPSQLTSDSAWPHPYQCAQDHARPGRGAGRTLVPRAKTARSSTGRRVDQAMAATGLTGHRLAPDRHLGPVEPGLR